MKPIRNKNNNVKNKKSRLPKQKNIKFHSQRTKEVEKESFFKKKYNRFVFWAGFLALLAGLITNIGKLNTFFQQNVKPLISSSKSEMIFEDTSKYNILLLPFGPDGTCELEKNLYHHQVHRRILQLIEKENLNIEVARQDTVMCDIVSSDSVLKYGKPLGSDLIIYGNYQERCTWDTTLINISYISSFGSGKVLTGETGYQKDSKNSLLSKLQDGVFTGDIEDIIYFFLGVAETNNRNWRLALDLFDKTKESKKDSIRNIAINAAKVGAYFNLEEYNSAIKHLDILKDKLRKEDSDLGNELDFLLGLAYSNLGNHLKTIQYLSKYTEGENLALAYSIIANSYAFLEDFHKGIEYFTRAINLSESETMPKWTLYMQRAYMFEAIDSTGAALTNMKLAIDLNPDCEECKDFRAQYLSNYTNKWGQ